MSGIHTFILVAPKQQLTAVHAGADRGKQHVGRQGVLWRHFTHSCSHLETADDLDFIPGCAWHDGLTNFPQQREEAGSVQQYQPATTAHQGQRYYCNHSNEARITWVKTAITMITVCPVQQGNSLQLTIGCRSQVGRLAWSAMHC